MSSDPGSPEIEARSRGRRSPPYALLLLGLVAGVLAMFGIVMWRDPSTRRRVRRGAEGAWRGVEELADRQAERLARRRRRLHAGARQVLDELWSLVDDLPVPKARLPFPPLGRRFYAHGAFMGAAPALLEDPRWRVILAFLMPDVYRDVREAARRGSRFDAIIPMFENNPVMAAYGVWHGTRAAGPPLEGMEWDVYLDGQQVEVWEEQPDRDAALVAIVDSMVIAHASTTDTVQEHIGLCQWADVRRTPKSRLGGVEPDAWMDLFGRALHLARVDDLREAVEAMRGEPRHDTHLECRRHTFVTPWPWARVLETWRAATGRDRFGVVLEVKSLRCTPTLLRGVVTVLNARGVEVVAVGSFSAEEIRGVGAAPQRVGGAELPGPRELVFFHFAGDLQQAVDRGALPDGASALFNGASLLVAHSVGGRLRYQTDDDVIDDLDAYRVRHRLELGLYVQENDCDAAAAALLSELVARRPETFALGFVWGGLGDEAAFAEGADRRGFGAQRALQRFARPWVRRRRPPSAFG